MSNFVRSAALSGLPELLGEFGVELAPLLLELGLPLDLIDDEDGLIEGESLGALLAQAAQLTDCPHFGLLLGSRQQKSILGLVGLIIESAPDAMTAFEAGVQYHHLQAQGVELSLEFEGDYAILKQSFSQLPQRGGRQAIDMALSQAYNLCRAFSNNLWSPKEVCFHYARPSETWLYRQQFGAKVTFDAEFNGMVFLAEYLQLPMPDKNDYLYGTLNRYATELSAGASADFGAQVRQVIRQLLPAGNCSIEAVARVFNCDKRTLQRRLKRRQLAYRGLLDGERFALACSHLQDTAIPVTTVAELVGFADVSAFARAFKQQFSLSPSQWRQQHAGR